MNNSAGYLDNGTEHMDNATSAEGNTVTKRQHLMAILLRIDECRQSLERLSRELGSLTDPQVVELSGELDRLILELYSVETSAKA